MREKSRTFGELLAAIIILALLVAMLVPLVNPPRILAEHASSNPQSVIVGFHPGTEISTQDALASQYGGAVSERNNTLDFIVVSVDNAAQFIDEIANEPAVKYAELNGLVYALESAAYTPNDPQYPQQWGVTNIKADLAWDIERGSASVVIAIVDTGIDYDHEDLGNYIDAGYDWVNYDSDPWDDHGHGTHCAGIAAATMDNSTGIAGIAQVSVVAEKVLASNGVGSDAGVANGIQDAADLGADIISLSLGGGYSQAVQDACQYAWDKGCIIVAASGNDYQEGIHYPAAYDTVICVGATNQVNQRASFSNWGAEMELVAPGVDILSTVPGDNYESWDGTSMATPHIAGVAALVWSTNSGLTNQQVRDLLTETADDLGATGFDEYYGYGKVDTQEAVNGALSSLSTVPNQPINVSPVDGTTDISPTPTLRSSAFADPDVGDSHTASQWQVATNVTFDGASIVYDSDTDMSNLIETIIPSATLSHSTTYYWHVRHRDAYGNWSAYSNGTSFTTIAMTPPSQPSNTSPANLEADVSVTPVLTSSAFSDPDAGDSHAASQWQITATSGDYSSPVYDSGTNTSDLAHITIPWGSLSYGTTYYWHVRHQDSYGNWSAYSSETSFITLASGVPNQPGNTSPANGTTDVSLTPILQSSVFSDPEAGDIHYASQWQITATSGDYSSPVFNSSVDTDNLVSIEILPQILNQNTTYYWRVRHQDSKGIWSVWSAETSFTTIDNQIPNQPSNALPLDGATDVSLTATLESSSFSDPDVGDSHEASRWQVTTSLGNYANPVFDSGTDTTNKTSATIPLGTLSYNTNYYWRVRHQDDHGNWSTWSAETSFRTLANQPPSQPSNASPSDDATDVELTPTLQSSAFSDPDAGDSHAASRWQVATDDQFADIVYDSGTDSTNKTEITIPSEVLSIRTTYYWRVRHQDDHGNWSTWSAEASFTTKVSYPPDKPMNISPADETTGISLTHTFRSSEFSDPDGDEHYASQWQITTTPGDYSAPAVLDSGVDIDNLIEFELPSGVLYTNTTYYWRVKHQDNTGTWSQWSKETNFRTIDSGDPSTPANVLPANGSTDQVLTLSLQASAFVSPNGAAEHAASQWQIATDALFGNVVYDSGVDASNLTSITVPAGYLGYAAVYYWRVRYYDSYRNWSDWSTETSFTTISSGASDQPIGVSPVDGASDLTLTPILESSAFSDPDAGDSHYASQWRITTVSGDYTVPAKICDSGVDTSNLVELTIPAGMLKFESTYYWIVRHQDSYGNWSDWSEETSFTTIIVQPPVCPINGSPTSGATDIALTPTLFGSVFSDPDVGDSHLASEWQIREDGTPADYSVTVFDSGTDSSDLTQITIPWGSLSYGSTYYWHVKYQDSYGKWSDWSEETDFTTLASGAPYQASNTSPANGATNLSLIPTLRSSAFSDPDVGDTHAASQWQIASDALFTSFVYDSGVDTANLTSITVPSGMLSYDTTYYWRVKHRDDKDNWSEWSAETSLTTVVSGIPNQPTNLSPADGTIDIVLAPGLLCSAFSDPDMGDSHYASRWQIASDALFASIVYDSSIDTSNLTSISIPPGTLSYDTTYYWRVRHQDSFGNWSEWSSYTDFTTVTPLPPNRPVNESPANGDTGVSLSPSLYSSAFSDPDVDDAHTASQWQIREDGMPADYSDTVFDSDISTSNLVKLTISSGTLGYDTTYYWRVKYRDRYDEWSGWSQETSFTTLASSPPRQPDNVSPSGKAASDTSLTLTLEASAFADTDPSDVHTASQWQITVTAGDYSTPTYDSEPDTSNLTQIAVPSGVLDYNIAYYWHVRYQDSYDKWSDWSEETSFTTAVPQANFSASRTEVQPGLSVDFTDLSKGDFTSWTWDFGDGKTKEWTTEDRAKDDGIATNIYLAAGTWTVSLTVTGPTGDYEETKDGYITVSEADVSDGGGGVPWVWIIVIGLVVIIGVLIVVRMRRR